MYKMQKFLFIFALFLGLFGNAHAQNTTGEIQGTIKDPQGAVVPNVAIRITGVDVGFNRALTTDEEGFYRARQIPPGIYTIVAEQSGGFTAQTKENVQVVIGSTSTVNFDLSVGSQQAVVNVTADDNLAVDATETKAQDNITAREIDNLPKGTTFSSVLRTTASTRVEPLSGQFQINGGSGAENSFIIDGQEVSNFRTGALNNNNDIPYQFVQELQVKSSGFEAEFGGATGGVVNVVTKSGSNDFHGEFGIQFNISKLRASERPVLVNSLTGLGDTGQFVEYFSQPKDAGVNTYPVGSFSGPIIKDKLWFFGIYAPQYLNAARRQTFVTGFGPTRRLIQDTDLPTFLRGRGIGNPVQDFRAQETREYAFIKLDANPTDKLRLSTSFTYNPIIQKGLFAGGAGITTANQPTANTTLVGTPSFSDFGGALGLLAGSDLAAIQGGRQNSNNFRVEGIYTPNGKLVAGLRYTRGFLNENLGGYAVPNTTRFRCRTGGAAFCGASSFQNTTGNFQYDRDVSVRNTIDADAGYLVGNFGGRHEFKGGYQFNRISNDVAQGYRDTGIANLYFGQTTFNNFACSGLTAPTNITILTPASELVGLGCLIRFGTSGNASNRNQALYIQDKWQPFNRLTLNLGVRTEKEDLPSFNGEKTNLNFSFKDKIAPRLGVAYALTNDGKTKISAFYGWFYDRVKFELARGSFGGDFYRVDYFEISRANQAYANFTPSFVVGNLGDPIGGACPIGGLAANSGYRTRCQVDYRVPSNLTNLVLANGAPIQPGAVDPNLKPFRQSEFTLEFQRELLRGSILTARYLYRNVDNAVEDSGFKTSTGSEFYIIANPGEGLHAQRARELGFERLAKPQRRYDAMQLEYDTRFLGNFNLNLNYTLSRLYGNYSGLASSDEINAAGVGRFAPGGSRYFDQPFVGFTASGQPDNGRLATDRPHVFKASGTYSFDWRGSKSNSTDLSFFTTAQSGTPLTTYVTVFDIDIPETVRGDLGRTETFTQTDLNLTHRYRFGRDDRFTVAFDFNVLNVFNEANALSVSNSRTSGFYGLSVGEVSATENYVQAVNTLTSGGIIQQLNRSIAADPGFSLNQAYRLPSVFQSPRTVRFGFRFLF